MALEMDQRGIILGCSSCGRRNRVPFAAKQAKCAGCKAHLPPPAAPIVVADARDFDALLASSPVPVVVDFWAPWCGPCRAVAPELARLAAANAGTYVVVKINTDALAELGERFQIRSIPTLAVFDGGREIGRITGARPAADIESFIRHSLATAVSRS